MGRYFALSLGLASQVAARPAKQSKAMKSGIKLGHWILGLILVLGSVYLLLVNSTSTMGYEIKKLEQQLGDAKEATKRLELEAASLKSIQNIQDSAKILNLIPTGPVKYPGNNGYAYQD